MTRKLHLTVVFLINIYLIGKAYALVEFTNIVCEAIDKDFVKFEYCRLKSVNRTYKYFTVRANLLQIPVTEAKVNAGLYKRLSTYKPFFYNVTIDGCKFFKNVKLYPVASSVYDFFKDVSNLNHTCPYDHDIIVNKLTADNFNHRFSNVLDFPTGDYMFKVRFIIYKNIRAKFQLYFSLK
ncbi:uncharacterized protein LOC121530567 [Drosophila eugracilis]|uniref:uncharacterized protein LOC121530567 n=1 Tax=Drosophila eugracilis TaxID=29029 RepID=UPI001BD9C284|nr:uncharacterized protein LOC121530567 [Drosophila eugracilis]